MKRKISVRLINRIMIKKNIFFKEKRRKFGDRNFFIDFCLADAINIIKITKIKRLFF